MLCTKSYCIFPFSYVELNTKFSSLYRRYSGKVPKYLHDRPRDFVIHCMDRIDNASELQGKLVMKADIQSKNFQLKSSLSSSVYHLQFSGENGWPRCTCPDFSLTCFPCKHFFYIVQKYPEASWNHLPQSYRNNVFFTLDENAMLIFQKEPVEATTEEETTIDAEATNGRDCPNEEMDDSDQSTIGTKSLDIDGGHKGDKNDMKIVGKETSHDCSSVAEACRKLAKSLISATYDITNYDHLVSLKDHLQKACDRVDKILPRSIEGLPLRKSMQKKEAWIRRRAKVTLGRKKTFSLPCNKKKTSYLKRCGISATRNRLRAQEFLKKFAPEKKKGAHKKESVETEIPPLFVGKNFPKEERIPSKKSGEDAEDIMITGVGTGEYSKRKKRNVSVEDTLLLRNYNSMLTDNLISIAQNILHAQFPDIGGLEDTTLGPYLQFSIQRGTFVQILHTGSLHWICTSNIGCREGYFTIYDSLYCGNIPSHVVKQICSIVHYMGRELCIRVAAVQQQTNGTNCGLFAIANATSLLHGIDPETVTFDEYQTREHLHNCIEGKKFLPFPTGDNITEPERTSEVFSYELQCAICRLPNFADEGNNPMKVLAECYACRRLYHRGCAQIPIHFFNGGVFYECEECKR